jgi:hypothetical protein
VSDAKAEEEDSSDEEDVKIGAVRLPSRFIRNTAGELGLMNTCAWQTFFFCQM